MENTFNIYNLKEKTINQTLVVFSLLAIISESLIVLRVLEYGADFFVFLNFSKTVMLWGLTIYRHKLSLKIKVVALVVLIFISLLCGLKNVGFLAPAKVFIVILPIFLSFVISFKQSIKVLIVFLSLYLLFAFLYSAGFLSYSINPLNYSSSLLAWLIDFVVFSLITLGLLYVGFNYNNSLINFNNKVQEQNKLLIDKEHRYSALFNKTIDTILMLKPSAEIFDCNQSASHLFGLPKNEIIGKSPVDFSPEYQPDNIKTTDKAHQLITLALNDIPQQFEWEHFNSKKERVFVLISLNKIELKESTYVQAIIHDITEKKKKDNELIVAKEKAEESDRLKTTFLQNMSHEIRTPMNAIIGFSSLLPDNFNNREKLESFAKIIELRCNDLLDIINDILDISKIESGQSIINLEIFSLSELFNELGLFFKDYKARINKQDIKIHFHLAPEGSLLTVKTDKLKLKQIIINLVSNSLKFTTTGSITCGYTQADGKLQFYVSDTGIGIPADKFDYIFERFSQLKHQTLQNIGGTGLGLPIVKGLVKLLGGNVWLESECDKGSTFYFTIDYLSVDTRCDTPLSADAKLEINSNRTILIVEDDFYNAEYLKEVLSNVTSNIITVSNGLSAAKIVQEQKIDLILMDIRLPDISGYEATQLILRDKPNMKIIAQTAYAANTEHQKAIEAGCVDYISKPIKQEQLLKMMKKYLK